MQSTSGSGSPDGGNRLSTWVTRSSSQSSIRRGKLSSQHRLTRSSSVADGKTHDTAQKRMVASKPAPASGGGIAASWERRSSSERRATKLFTSTQGTAESKPARPSPGLMEAELAGRVRVAAGETATAAVKAVDDLRAKGGGVAVTTATKVDDVYAKAVKLLKDAKPNAYGEKIVCVKREGQPDVIVREFVAVDGQDPYNGARTEEMLNRHDLTLQGAIHWIESERCPLGADAKSALIATLKQMGVQSAAHLEHSLGLDPKKMREMGKSFDKEFQAKFPEIEKHLGLFFREVQAVIDANLDEGSFTLSDLADAEKQYVVDKGNPKFQEYRGDSPSEGRADMMHIYTAKSPGGDKTVKMVSGYFGVGKQIPSSVRDNPTQTANHVISYNATVLSETDGEAEIEMNFVGRRHSSPSTIAVEDEFIRQQGAYGVIERDIEDMAQAATTAIGDVSMYTQDNPLPLRLPIVMLFTPTRELTDSMRNRAFGVVGKWKGESERMQMLEEMQAINTYNGKTMQLTLASGEQVWVRAEIRAVNRGANVEATKREIFGVDLVSTKQERINNRGLVQMAGDFGALAKSETQDVRNVVRGLGWDNPNLGLDHDQATQKETLERHLQKMSDELKGYYDERDELLVYLNKGTVPDHLADEEALLSRISGLEAFITSHKERIEEVEVKLGEFYRLQFDAYKEKFLGAEATLQTNYIDELDLDVPDQRALYHAFRAYSSYFHERHWDPDHVMDFQTELIQAYSALGDTPLFHCKSAEDRTGDVDDKATADCTARRLGKKGDTKARDKLEAQYEQFGISRAITGQCCPGAEGLQVKAAVNKARTDHGMSADHGRAVAQLHKGVPKRAAKISDSKLSKATREYLDARKKAGRVRRPDSRLGIRRKASGLIQRFRGSDKP